MMNSEIISQNARKIKDKDNLRGVPQIRKMTARGGIGRAETENLSIKLSSIESFFPWKVIFSQSQSSIKGRLLSKVIFYQRLSSIKGCFPLKIVFHLMLFSIEGCLPSKVIFHLMSSSIEVHLSLKVVFNQRLSSIEGRLPSKVLFHQMSSSIKGRLPSSRDITVFRPIRGLEIGDRQTHRQTDISKRWSRALSESAEQKSSKFGEIIISQIILI